MGSLVSKSRGPQAHVGSIPTSGTNFNPTQLLFRLFISNLNDSFMGFSIFPDKLNDMLVINHFGGLDVSLVACC